MVEQDPVPEDEPPPDDSTRSLRQVRIWAPDSAGGTGPSIGLVAVAASGIGNRKRRAAASKFGWYAAKVQSAIREALGRNPSTRSATLSLQVRDLAGLLTVASPAPSSSDPPATPPSINPSETRC